ncbi:MAG: hypothetical protein ACE5JO_06995, partial [Candidatus Binatia bacterium]
MFFIYRWSSTDAENWHRVGELPRGVNVERLAVSEDGVGVIGGYVETLPRGANLNERMLRRKAVVWRLQGQHLEKVYEGPGWVQSIDHAGPDWFAVVGTLKVTGTGSNYRLIGSSDAAKTWNEIGKIAARSITQILPLTSSVVYVFGASTLMVTKDGGKSWTPLPFPGVAKGRGFAESIAPAQEGGLLAFGIGLMLMRPGTAMWETILTEQYRVEAVTDPFVAAVAGGEVQVFRRTPEGFSVVSELPEDRHPVRIATEWEIIRIITHPRHPEKLGFFMGGLDRVLFRSDDGGRSWKSQGLKAI